MACRFSVLARVVGKQKSRCGVYHTGYTCRNCTVRVSSLFKSRPLVGNKGQQEVYVQWRIERKQRARLPLLVPNGPSALIEGNLHVLSQSFPYSYCSIRRVRLEAFILLRFEIGLRITDSIVVVHKMDGSSS